MRPGPPVVCIELWPRAPFSLIAVSVRDDAEATARWLCRLAPKIDSSTCGGGPDCHSWLARRWPGPPTVTWTGVLKARDTTSTPVPRRCRTYDRDVRPQLDHRRLPAPLPARATGESTVP
ncbi:hypothetical protein GCM10010317_054250 [Streptomyces mirabilis]|nr:hypothetical protein GCM10010317_054250 [Streptomyces mirabilis]